MDGYGDIPASYDTLCCITIALLKAHLNFHNY